MGRAQRTQSLGSQGSIYDDLRITRSCGGFGSSTEDELAGIVALLRSLGHPHSVERAVLELTIALDAVCSEIPASEINRTLASESLYTLMCLARPPDFKMERIRQKVGDPYRASAEVVRKYEDKLLLEVARVAFDRVRALPPPPPPPKLPPETLSPQPRTVGYSDFESVAVPALRLARLIGAAKGYTLQQFTDDLDQIDPLRPVALDQAIYESACVLGALEHVLDPGIRTIAIPMSLNFAGEFCEHLYGELTNQFSPIGVSYLQSVISDVESNHSGFYGFWSAISISDMGMKMVRNIRDTWTVDCPDYCAYPESIKNSLLLACSWHNLQKTCLDLVDALIFANGADAEKRKRARSIRTSAMLFSLDVWSGGEDYDNIRGKDW